MKDRHLSLVMERESSATAQKRQLHPEIADALNQQLHLEFESSYMYLGMSTYFLDQDLDGFSKWFRLQAREELQHAMKVYDYLQDRDADVTLPALMQPSTNYSSPLDAVSAGLEHEQKISLRVNELYGMAQREGEYDTAVFLQWFLEEQVEEEGLFKRVVNQLRRIEAAGDLAPLLILDTELGKRGA